MQKYRSALGKIYAITDDEDGNAEEGAELWQHENGEYIASKTQMRRAYLALEAKLNVIREIVEETEGLKF